MTNRAHQANRIFAISLALALAGTAGALAAAPLNGKTYEGGAPTFGLSEGHRERTHASGNLVLRVNGSGSLVTVRFSSAVPLLYCSTQERLHVQTSKPASVSRSGSFKATIGQRFTAGPGAPAIVQVITGRFSGHTVKGTINTHAAEFCSGVASFSATAR